MKNYRNRELSWLSFNERVLQEAEDANNPLLERVKFLGIFSNNQDEFFRVRVASVRRAKQLGSKSETWLDIKAGKLLKLINREVIRLQERFQKVYADLIKLLEEEGIKIIDEHQLDEDQQEAVRNYFRETVRPLLVPIMLNYTDVPPALLDHNIYHAIKMETGKKDQPVEYSIIKIPTDRLNRFFTLPSKDNQQYIILLDDIIRFNLDEIFHIFNYKSIKAYTLKVTRDAELDISNDLSKSFLEKIKESVLAREKATIVRLVYDSKMPQDLFDFLINHLNLQKAENIIPGGRYHNFKDFMNFPSLGKPSLNYESIKAIQVKGLGETESLLDKIKEKDLLLIYPYHSFNFLIDLLREAAIDPNVASIKITLYRVAKDSKVINALINAAKNGKEVTVVMEIRARFDEINNINFSSELQENGIRIIFADPELKVHSKMVLITRAEKGKMVQYANVSTGNYHEGTSKFYSDLSLFTTDKRITAEVNKVFKFIKRIIRTYKFSHFIVSPRYMRSQIMTLIDQEIEAAKEGKPAFLKFKLNNLVDRFIVKKLYEASKAGVKIQMIIRTCCSVIPGIKDLSENIEVISILDRYLEHSRFYIFGNLGNEKIYIASADLMPRNLDDRIEILCPVFDDISKKIIKDMFDLQWSDNMKARIQDEQMQNNYVKNGNKKTRSQFELYDYLRNL